MKIYVFGTRGFPGIQGGVEKHCEALYPDLSNNLQITVFRRKPYVSETPIYRNIRFIDLSSTKIKGFEALFHSLICTFISIWKRPDIIHIHNIGPGCFIPLLRLFGRKVVLTYHSANYEHKKWGKLSQFFLKISEFIALRFSNRIIFVNKYQLEKQNISTKKKSVYIPNGTKYFKKIESTEYITSIGLITGKYILAVGRITPEKGFDDLVNAFNNLIIDKDYKLVIAGGVEHEGEYWRKLKEKSTHLPIIYTGVLSSEKLRELYSHALLFVLSSHNEGFPLVVLEAMQAGCDLILSDIPATRLLNLPEHFFYPMGDVNELSKKLMNKIKNNNYTTHSYDLSKYKWSSICQQTEEVYNSLT